MLLDECLSKPKLIFVNNVKRGSIMFCPKCGAQNPDGSPFCASCGAQIGAQQPQQPMMNQGGGNNPMGGFNPQDMMNDFKNNIGNFKSFKLAQFITLGGAAVLLISIFLPFLSVKMFGISVSASLLKGGALHWLLAILIALCAGFVAVTKKGMPMLIVGCVAVAYFIMEFFVQKEEFATFSIGFYFMLLGCAAICVGGVMQFLEDKKG